MINSIFGLIDSDARERAARAEGMADAAGFRGGNAIQTASDGDVLIGVRGFDSEPALALAETPAILSAVEGEIYNGAEIRGLLGSSSGSAENADCRQAIPALYEKFGDRFPKYLNGHFGLALWDKRRRRLLLARDHLGSHSLFYCSSPGAIRFATVIHSILAPGQVSREISLAAIDAYLCSCQMPAPFTPLREVQCVRPGFLAIYENGRWVESVYWNAGEIREDFQRKEEDWIAAVREIVLDAIDIRAAHGGKFGTLTSGGVDSGVISARLAGKLSNGKLPAFAIDFSQRAYSDRTLQDIMFERYPLEPHTHCLTAQEFAATLQLAVPHLDRPVNDVAFVGMYHAFRLGREAGCTAVFDGEGGDEDFFTGHTHGERRIQQILRFSFPGERRVLRAFFPNIPLGDSFFHKASRYLYRLGLPAAERSLTRLPSFYNHPVRILREIGGQPLPDPLSIGKEYLRESALTEPLNRYNFAVLKTQLPDGLLYKNERMAALNGLVNRTPFIDYRVVELAYSIPERYKIVAPSEGNDGTKQVLKKAMRGVIPDEILFRRKARGFSHPSDEWFRHELKPLVYDALCGRDSLVGDYLDRSYINRLVDDHCSGRIHLNRHVAGLLVLELWLRAFLKPAGTQSDGGKLSQPPVTCVA